jgi:ankyrin repeat protein
MNWSIIISLFFLLAISAEVSAQKTATADKGKASTVSKPVPKVKSKLLVDSDADCFLKVNGKEVGNVKAGKPRLIPAFVGENTIEAIYGTKTTTTPSAKKGSSTNSPTNEIMVKKTVNIPDTNTYKFKVEFFNNEQLNNYLRENKKDMVELTLKKNPNAIKPTEDEGLNPLLVAIAKKDVSLVKFLLDNGANPNIITGSSPLNSAIQCGCSECVKLLLASGAKINERGDDGRFPLEEAVFWAKYEVVKLLLEKGADPNIKTIEGVTLLELATDKGLDTIVNELKKYGAK